VLRAASIVMLILLLTTIVLQYNDPDGWIWMLIYGVALIPTVAALAKTWTGLSVVAAIGYYAGVVYTLPGGTAADPSHILTDLQMGEAGVEEAREAVGLLLCAVWMTVLGAIWWRNRNKTLVK
jgi:hypothetical protein